MLFAHSPSEETHHHHHFPKQIDLSARIIDETIFDRYIHKYNYPGQILLSMRIGGVCSILIIRRSLNVKMSDEFDADSRVVVLVE